MRNWGIVITICYALIFLGLVVPGAVFLDGSWNSSLRVFFQAVRDIYGDGVFQTLAVAMLASQPLLLFLSVDTSHKRLKPRTHIAVSCTVAAFLTALLTSGVIWSLGFAIRGDNFWDLLFEKKLNILAFWGALWVVWAVVFYLYFRNSTAVVTRLVSWLLRGSVLELLIAVPCHVIVRRRQDCSAPAATSFGIATGIAIMLLSFGPGILLLYKKRLDAYSTRRSA
jgi:hypothetical protein